MTRTKVARLLCLLTVTVVVSVGTASAGAAEPSPPWEVFTGPVDDFYVVPDPLPPAPPGTLIRVQPVRDDATGHTVRIMYHSVDAAGRDRAVTGTLTYPDGPSSTGGRPIVTVANGTVGLAPACAPSRSDRSLGDHGIGAVVVASDYIGSGPPGELQAYLSRESEGHSVLDAARAARAYTDTGAGTDLLIIGGSQGGHGALAANELAPDWAPEFDVLGTVALAPAAMFDRTYGPLDELVTTVVTAMGIVGMATEHPEASLTDYVSPAGMDVVAAMHTVCAADLIPAVLGVEGGFFTHDPRTTEPARSIMLANDVGHVATATPVLLLQGDEDWTVTPLRTDDLFARMCDAGQVTEYVTYPGADHDTIGAVSATRVRDWFRDRLAGVAATDSCGTRPTAPVPTTTITTAPTVDVSTPGIPPVPAVVDAPRTTMGELPATGAAPTVTVLVGLALCLIGSVTVATTRRRRDTA